MDSGRAAVGFCEDLDVVGDHIGGIEAESEVPDDPVSARFFVFFEEIRRARKGDLRDIALDLLLAHADPVVLDGEGARLLVRGDGDLERLVSRLGFADVDEFLKFRDRVRRVRDNLAQKDVLIRIQPFFNDGHHVFA